MTRLESSWLRIIALLDTFENDRIAVVDLLAVAIDLIRADAQLIKRAVEAQDVRAAVGALQHLRETSASIYSSSLVEIGALIEAALIEGRSIAAFPLLVDLCNAVDELRAEIHAQSRLLRAEADQSGFVRELEKREAMRAPGSIMKRHLYETANASK